MSSKPCKVVSTEPLVNEDARWMKMKKLTYTDPDGARRTWESAERTTRPASGVDGVGIVAIIEVPVEEAPGAGKTTTTTTATTTNGHSNTNGNGTTTTTNGHGGTRPTTVPHIILQKQYRPPADRVCIEIPAGLIDEGEDAETAALRELREETGYVGRIAETSPLMFNDPGFCNTNLQMVHVLVDASLPENADPKPQLEDGELIFETFTAPLATLWQTCRDLEAGDEDGKGGYAIDARVGTLAEGIELARQFKLFSGH